MTTLNDFNKVNGVTRVMAEDVNVLISAAMRAEYSNVETLAATRTLLDVDTPIQRFDCNGADRDVNVPTADVIDNHLFLIVNASDGGEKINIKNNAGTVILSQIAEGESAFLLPDGNGEYIEVRTGPRDDDWTKVTDTWTYASANTANIPSDGTLVYQKGDKFRLKQGGGWKEFYCTAITATLMTLTGGTDHVIANAAITDIAYSRAVKPFGFTNWKNCAAPVYDTANIDNGTGGVQPATTETLFRIDGDSLKLKTRLATTNVVKNGAGQLIAFTIPLTLPNIVDATFEVLGTASIGNLNHAAAPQVKTTSSINIVSTTSIADNASIVGSSVFFEWRY